MMIAVGYVLAEIYLFSVHEPWRDEAQAWLVARDLRTPLEFLIIPGEGHPPLWYWLMRVLSLVLSFDQARLIMLGVVALNALLLTRLLHDRILLLVAVLCSVALLHYWGFYFRPYAVILTCVAAALLLERSGRSNAAGWLVAIACGLHFYSGFLLAFWLLVQLRRRMPLLRLAGPALLGAAFGLSAILSGAGNPAGTMKGGALLPRVVDSFSALFPIPGINGLVGAAIIVIVLAFGLRRSPYMLACLLGLLLVFAGFAALVYGFAAWHVSFALLLVLMAWSFDRAAPGWLLALLLIPQDISGIMRSIDDATQLASPDEVAYEAVSADAGARFDPARNLIAWPDFLLTPAAARHNIRYLSGNNGAVIGAVDWRNRGNGDINRALLTTTPTPYWLVCADCTAALETIRAIGRTATEVLPLQRSLIEPIAAYRID